MMVSGVQGGTHESGPVDLLRKGLHVIRDILAIALLACVVAAPGMMVYQRLTRDTQLTGNEGSDVLGVSRPGVLAGNLSGAALYLESDPAVQKAVVDETEAYTPVNYIQERVREDERQVMCLGNLAVSRESLDALNALLRSYPNSISVKAVTVDGTKGLSFNSGRGYQSSSTIKGPYAFYCYLQMEEGNGSLDDTMTYTGAYYAEGTGSIRYRPTGTTYTIRELLYRTLWESDNISYAMCVSKWGYDGYNEYMDSLGCDSLKLQYTIWPNQVTVEDLVIVWSEIYRYFEEGSELSQVLYDSCTPGAWNCLSGAIPDNCIISQKYGWAGSYGDGAIVRTPQGDYILSVFVNSPGSDYDRNMVTRVVAQVHEIMAAERLTEKGR